MTRAVFGLIAALALSGCATPPRVAKDMSAFDTASPHSILVVPAVNRSLDVDAPNYLLSALTVPLAEKGYYVFPIHTTQVVLQQEGFYEGEQIRNEPTAHLAGLFGADAVLYVTVARWDAQYVLITTTVTVEFDYRLVGKDGTELWTNRQRLQYSPQQNSTGNALANLVAAAITAAMTRAAPNYMPLTRQANVQAIMLGPDALPDGPYRKPAK